MAHNVHYFAACIIRCIGINNNKNFLYYCKTLQIVFGLMNCLLNVRRDWKRFDVATGSTQTALYILAPWWLEVCLGRTLAYYYESYNNAGWSSLLEINLSKASGWLRDTTFATECSRSLILISASACPILATLVNTSMRCQSSVRKRVSLLSWRPCT